MNRAYRPYCFFDAPAVLDCSVTPIPASGSSPLEVIADSGGIPGVGISYHDSTGEFIGVYVGAVGDERLLCVIGNGTVSVAWGWLAKNSRVSLRSMRNQAITAGMLYGTLVAE